VRLGETARVWTSGVASWLELAARGVWVEGCAENLGFEELRPQLAEPVLRLPPLASCTIVTHEGAAAGWEAGRVLATYRVAPGKEAAQAVDDVAAATHLYWSSGSQFEKLGRHARASAHHACGPGKTAGELARAGVTPHVFPSVEEWRAWITK
jgi:hydroxymethylbilane synthase